MENDASGLTEQVKAVTQNCTNQRGQGVGEEYDDDYEDNDDDDYYYYDDDDGGGG